MAVVQVEMTGDEARLWRAQQKVLAQQAKMANEYKRIAKEAKGAEKAAKENAAAMEGSFGHQALGELKSYALGLVSIQAGVQGVTMMLQKMRQAAEEAGARGREAAEVGGPMLQMGRTPAEKKHNLSEAKKSFEAGATETLGQARQLQFDLANAGFQDDREFVADLAASNVIKDPSKMVLAAKAMQASYGADKTGPLEAMVDKAFGASELSSASAEQLMEATAGSADTASKLGIGPDESQAAIAMIANTAGGASQADTQYTAFLTGLSENKEYAGKDLNLKNVVEEIKAKNSGPEALKKALGGKIEAVKGFASLAQQMEDYDKTLENIAGADEQNLATKAIEFSRNEPGMAAAQQARKQKNQLASASETLGSIENLADAARDADSAAMRKKYGTGFGGEAMVAANEMGDAFVRLFAGSEYALESRLDDPASTQMSESMSAAKRDELRQNYEAIKAQEKATENLAAAARDMKEAATRQRGSSAGAARREAASAGPTEN